MNFWTPERIAELKRLCALGLSYGEIGARLGCTRNAALGKARRLGVSNGRLPDAPKQSQNGGRPKKTQPLPIPPASVVIPVNPTDITDLKPEHCRYPLWGDSDAPNFLYCGAEIVPGFPWCPGHFHRCVVIVSKRESTEPGAGKAEAA